MSNLTPEQRIQRTHVRMMAHPATVAFSSVLMVGDTEVTDQVPTACTNGRDTKYGAEFVKTLSDAEVVGLVLHENLHKVYQHHWLWKELWKENPRLANMAADYVINLEILDMSKKHGGFVKLPEQGLVDEKYRGMSTLEVFNDLKQNGTGEGGEGGEGGLDDHDFTELTETEVEELKKEIDDAVRQGALLAGKQGGDVSRVFDELMTPKIDWREQMQEFLSSVFTGRDDSTWRRPNRRWLAQNIYLPSAVSESMGALVVAVDSSGSISDRQLASFLSEICGICDSIHPELLHLLSVDARVQSHEVFSRDDFGALRDKRSFAGGGGTDMREIFTYIADNNINAEAVVVLTDGYTPYPTDLPIPTLWVMTTSEVAPIGSSVYLDLDA